ncbi:MAG: hypothetical protein ACREU1_13195 [Burkholderiales bacterium]
MMVRIILLAIALGGCGASSSYRSDGPCRGFHRDPAGCERAHANAQAIGQVKLGLSTAEVLAIMGGGPERKDARADVESWTYRTDYRNRIYTTIHFQGGVVTEIKSGR